ncbi:MAG: integrase arm-type DNA-binding domain-containing protein [Hyphomicrobiaceae bacterium]
MGREIKKLGTRKVETAKPGRHSDGGGLYLLVEKSGARRWLFIYRRKRDGKQSEMGLGSFHAVPLARARELAAEARRQIADGIDPLQARAAARSETAVPTFGELAEAVIASLESGWRNDKHRAQWRSTLGTYATPIRNKPVDAITTEDVLAVLTPIWTAKAETASRVRGRIEKILDAAKAKGLRSGENPARWRGHLDNLLPKRQKLQRGHHPAMPWVEVPAFVARLRERPSVSTLALEFVILTGARSGEVLRSVRDGKLMGARWEEIDREAKVWTVPAERMKGGRDHRVPLTERALAILDKVAMIRQSEFVFPGQRGDRPLSESALEELLRRMDAKPATVHGFRSSFRDWVHEATNFSGDLAEAALAHITGDKVERAYRRGDALERRRELMEAWEQFLDTGSSANRPTMSPVKIPRDVAGYSP